MAERRTKLPFIIALLAAPALVGAAASVFGFMGDYGSRFMVAGGFGLVAVLPAWFLVYPWLAWRDPLSNGWKPRVKSSLAANFASLVIYPAIIMLVVATDRYDVIFPAEEAAAGAEFSETPAPRDAALISAIMAFMLGLVFMPMLSALATWIERKVRRA